MKHVSQLLTAAVLFSLSHCVAGAPALAVSAQHATDRRGPGLCAPWPVHRQWLAARFKEHPVASGQIGPGRFFRLTANRVSGRWTLLVLDAVGRSCVSGAGTGFRADRR